MKTITILFAFALAAFSVNAQNNTPNPPGNGYGLYHHFSNVTPSEVTSFLERTGHEVLNTPRTTDAGRTWFTYTLVDGRKYYTEVYTDGDNIVDFNDTIVD